MAAVEPIPSPELIRTELARISTHPLFIRSARVRRFLEFTIGYQLAGRGKELKEFLLGVEVFDRAQSYDPRVDPIVRVEARRVRSKLQAYYHGDGCHDEVVIAYPCGSYVPEASFRSADGQSQPPVIAVLPFVPDKPRVHGRFAESLTQELIRELGRCRAVRVLSDATRQVRVEGLLTGRVGRRSHRVHVTAQLVSTRDAQELWSAAFDSVPENVRTAQKQIAFATAHALSAHFSRAR